MRVYVVNETALSNVARSGATDADAASAAIRRTSEQDAPRRRVVSNRGGERTVKLRPDRSPLRVAGQFRSKVRQVVADALASGRIDDDGADAALRALRKASAPMIADLVALTGSYTFPVPGVGAVVMEGAPGEVGDLSTAGDRTQHRIDVACATMRLTAIEAARAEVLEIEAAA